MNFVMNLYLYALLTKTLKRTVTRIRVWTGSALGAVCCTLLPVMPGIPVFIKRFAGPMAVSMAVTAGIFRMKHVSSVVKAAGYLYVYAFVFGGMMKFLFLNIPFLHKAQGSIWYILGAGMLGYQVTAWWLAQLKKRKEPVICRVRICGCGNGIWLKALIDTGNSLREPVSGKPVSVVDADIFGRLNGVRLPEKLKVIPYRSIGQENGMMEGYEVPEIIIDSGEGLLRQQKAVVGISRTKVSADGRYQMILHPDLCGETSGERTDVPAEGQER